MHQRKQMVLAIRAGELNIAQAARVYGVAKNTVRLWLRRACEDSVEKLEEFSRRPKATPRATPNEIEEQILEWKQKKPSWGAKKIVAKAWPQGPPLCVRTADRILARHGLVGERPYIEPNRRFEREEANQLWQTDFKGLGRQKCPYSPLSVLDDATRFCLGFEPVPDHRTPTVFGAFWNLFGEYGMPEAFLSDNDTCFREITCVGPSALEARLWLLGIDMIHGRPLHPQTQGKVERFHGTVKSDLGSLLWHETIELARPVFASFVHEYNYERPHESLGMKTPGQVYVCSARKRPAKMPEHEIPAGAVARKVDASGKFRHKCKHYRAGHGLKGQYVAIQEDENGVGVYFAGRRFADLSGLLVG